jgi:uncharacterized protein YjgD (DUF1641 family)
MAKRILFIIVGLAVVAGCIFILYKSYTFDKHQNLNVPTDVVNKDALDIDEEAVSNITENISSPVEIAALIKSLGVPFSKDILAPTEFVANYNTNYAQSFALGVFSADLGYLNMYNKTGSVIDYLSTIKSLADDINVGQFFDFTTLKRLASNSSNIDSLKYISVHSFNLMDKSLRERHRGNLSALIVAGAWLEGIYVTVQVAKEQPDQKLIEKIGEQKIILSDLMLLLATYAKDPIFKNYLNEFQSIKAKFEDVNITYVEGAPETVEENGMLTIKQTSKSIVNITDDQLKSITATVEGVRNRLIRM